MYHANSTPSLYTHNAHVQCTVQRRKPTLGLFAALLFLCAAVITQASAQEPARAIKVMAQTQLEYLYIQITFFHNKTTDWFVDDTTYSYEMCQSRRAEDMYDWETRGDHSFVEMVRFICIPKGKIP